MAEERQVCDTSTIAADKLACKCRRDSLEIMKEGVTMRRWVAKIGRWMAKIGRWMAKIGEWVAKIGRWMAKIGRWVAKLVPRLLDTAALWVLSQTSLKNIKWAT
jgi:hypothetical protein